MERDEDTDYVEGPLLEDLPSFSHERSDDDGDGTYLETRAEDDSDYADEFEGAADNDTDGDHEDSDVSSCAFQYLPFAGHY